MEISICVIYIHTSTFYIYVISTVYIYIFVFILFICIYSYHILINALTIYVWNVTETTREERSKNVYTTLGFPKKLRFRGASILILLYSSFRNCFFLLACMYILYWHEWTYTTEMERTRNLRDKCYIYLYISNHYYSNQFETAASWHILQTSCKSKHYFD